MFRYVLPVILPLASSPAALAQHHAPSGHAPQSGGHAPSLQTPYAGFETRSIKALSDQQIEDLKQGRGIGFALAAELNGYPGPSHVLELAGRLELSPGQKRRMEELYNAMKTESVELGARLIEQEAALDQHFSRRQITANLLSEITMAIGVTQAKLRNTHLKYHLLATDVLKPEQVRKYNTLRGYTPVP